MNNASVLNKTIELIMRLFDAQSSTVPMINNTKLKPMPGIAPTGSPAERVEPEAEGIPSEYIEQFLRELNDDRTLDMHRVMIYRHGKLLSDCCYGLNDPALWRMTFSAAKSVTSLAIGMLIDRGLLSVKDRVTKFFDKKLTPLSRLTLKELTVEDLLTMRSCVLFNEATCMTEDDWQRGFLNAITVGEMGKDFNYNSLNSYMLASIVNVITKKTLSEFLRETLFRELDIKEFFWETCPLGIEKGGWGLYIHPEDIAKLGQLVLDNGVWNGKRLISEEYLRVATAFHAATPPENGNYNYGYHIWVGRSCNCFLFNGMFGQNVLGFKDNGILVVSNAGNEELFQSSSFYTIAEKYFGRDFADTLPSDGKSTLRETERAFTPTEDKKKGVSSILGFFKKRADSLPPECRLFSGRVYTPDKPHPAFGLLPLALQATQNNYTSGLTSIAFAVKNDTEFVVSFAEREAVYTFPVGFGGVQKTNILFEGEPFRLNTAGRFGTDEDGNAVLTLTLAFAETPFTRQMKIRFIKDSLYNEAVIEIKERPGASYIAATFNNFIKSMNTMPLLNSVISKADTDYITYKIDRVFEPVIEMSERKEK